MIVLGLSLAAYESYFTQSISPLAWSAVLTIAVFILAYIFWRAGAWAGGDVKLFTGLAALNPFNPFVLGSFFHFSFVFGGRELIVASTLPFFMLNLFMGSVIALMPYSAFLAFTVLNHKSHRKEFVQITRDAFLRALDWGLLIVLFTHVLNQLSVSPHSYSRLFAAGLFRVIRKGLPFSVFEFLLRLFHSLIPSVLGVLF